MAAMDGSLQEECPICLSEECPICLSEFGQADLCRTPCNHSFCTGCFERTLSVGLAPTSGSCPMCREPVSLYSAVAVVSGEPLRKPRYSGIAAAVYVQHGGVGIASYHLAASLGAGTSDGSYIDYTAAPAEWVLDDGARPPERKPFLDASYETATRTFRGCVEWPAPGTFHGDARWDYEMIFDHSFGFIAAGQLRSYGADGALRSTKGFPAVLQYSRHSAPPTSIVGQTYMQLGSPGVASYHFEECGNGARTPLPQLLILVAYTHYTATLRSATMVNAFPWPIPLPLWFTPTIGERMPLAHPFPSGCPTTSACLYPAGCAVHPLHACAHCLTRTPCIVLLSAISPAFRVWSVCRADAFDNAYISYASAPEHWRLDADETEGGGGPPPARKPFEAPSYDHATGTFRGTVRWPPPGTLHGDARWEYEMIFSEDFGRIQGGRVRASPRTGLDFPPPRAAPAVPRDESRVQADVNVVYLSPRIATIFSPPHLHPRCIGALAGEPSHQPRPQLPPNCRVGAATPVPPPLRPPPLFTAPPSARAHPHLLLYPLPPLLTTPPLQPPFPSGCGLCCRRPEAAHPPVRPGPDLFSLRAGTGRAARGAAPAAHRGVDGAGRRGAAAGRARPSQADAAAGRGRRAVNRDVIGL